MQKLDGMREAHSTHERVWAAELDSKAVEEAEQVRNSANAAELVQKLEEMRGAHSEQEEIWTSGLEDAAASVLLVSETRAALAAAEESGAAAAARVVELEDKLRGDPLGGRVDTMLQARARADERRASSGGGRRAPRLSDQELTRRLQEARRRDKAREERVRLAADEAAAAAADTRRAAGRDAHRRAVAVELRVQKRRELMRHVQRAASEKRQRDANQAYRDRCVRSARGAQSCIGTVLLLLVHLQ